MKISKTLIATIDLLIVGVVSSAITAAAPAQNQPSLPGYDNAGVQLNRTREYLERQRVARQIAEDRAKQKVEVEDKRGDEQQKAEGNIKFQLNEVKLDESKALNKEELGAITDKYIGKEVTLNDLYDIVNDINALYEKKGYLTCRAFLAPQTIKKGVVHIKLVEGVTGAVHVTGNDTTNKSYITDRIGIKKGELGNIHEMNEDLLRFNGTNDVQLRITMHAGQEEGSTDYVISVFEPQKSSVSVYTDNAGSKSSGEWREGLFFSDRSLTGNRDTMMLSGMRSDGTKSFSMAYAVPVGRSGTKLGLNYSTNSVHITDGDLKDLNVRGHSNAYGVSLIQPLVVTEKLRTEASLDYSYQNSKTDFLGIHWVDDTTRGYTAAFSMTNYGDSSVIYQRHGYRIGDGENIDDAEKNFGKYVFNSFWQKAYKSGQVLSARLDAQWSGNNYLPSSEQFYIGGMYSVRGYEESLLGGDHGYTASMEYAVPLDKAKKTSAFVFFDYGAVMGDSAFDDHILAGTGAGLKTTITGKIYSSLTLGVPLRRHLNGTEVSKTRIHFMLNGQF